MLLVSVGCRNGETVCPGLGGIRSALTSRGGAGLARKKRGGVGRLEPDLDLVPMQRLIASAGL